LYELEDEDEADDEDEDEDCDDWGVVAGKRLLCGLSGAASVLTALVDTGEL